MTYLLKTERLIPAFAIAISLSAGSSMADEGSADKVDVQACFALEHEAEYITSQTAYDIAQCFSGLAEVLVENHYYEFSEGDSLWAWSDANALFHYADSWFLYAAYKGHPYAEDQLMLTREALDY